MSTIELSAAASDLRSLAEQSNAWPFEQAKAIVARLKKQPKDEVLFETGYGPSGLRQDRSWTFEENFLRRHKKTRQRL